ncbi:MAG TPA: glycoside hydrolase family 6 protein [Anaerolineae bacterium]|nr:glycoside hydrolase family 6 protein [Anaerolineae bacterium]
MSNPRKLIRFLLVSAVLAALILSGPVLASAKSRTDHSGSSTNNTRFYVPPPNPDAIRQIARLILSHNTADAKLIAKMIATPQAVWIDDGTPNQTRKSVQQTMLLARLQHAVPVFVAYNVPGRDCSNLSAGGAATEAEYKAWIDAIASGIGNGNAFVIVEPDGLGLLPSNCPVPVPSTDAQRYRELNYAVDALEAKPNTSVYLDATHSAWQNVHDASTRLMLAGVERSHGFFLNASNYQYSENQVHYGTWISKCIARLSANPGAECPDQYWNGGPLPSLIAQTIGEWTGDALSRYGVWSDTDTTVVTTPAGPRMPFNTSGENIRYADTTGLTHFVIDTSRNGVGPWNFGASYPNDGVAQDWCNPPGRGLGLRPTANTGNPLVDAYLWIKIPGESDGQCTRGTPGPQDPERGIVDPAAGAWFPEMALELVHNANPALQ